MSTIGSHPGAILFRLSIMIVLIAIMMVVFFSYLEDTERELEQASVLQTKRIIDSALAVVFATYAVNNRLNDLNELDAGNPFVFLEEYSMLPPAYVGEIERDISSAETPGWYFLKHRGLVVYKSYFDGSDRYFEIVLNYADNNQSGSFESGSDKFQNLSFVRVTDI